MIGLLSLIAIALSVLLFFGARKFPLIIAGDVTKEQTGFFKNHIFFQTRHFRVEGKRIDTKEYTIIGKLTGDSLSPFGLPDGTTVFCKDVDLGQIKRNDVLIVETTTPPNKGRLKGRVTLGFWGDENESDEDLIRFEGYTGTVKDYFEKVSPEKYDYSDDKIYKGPYEGLLKTLSFDRENTGLKVSRPHALEKIVARVELSD